MNSNEVPTATLEAVLCSSVRIDNCQALADRYCDLTGMTTWVIWNTTEYGNHRFCLLDQGQLNCLRLGETDQFRIIYCSDQPGKWIFTPDEIDPPLAFGHVRDLSQRRIPRR